MSTSYVPTPDIVELGVVYHDGRRWIRVETIYSDGKAGCRVIARKAGDRIVPANTPTTIAFAALQKMQRTPQPPKPRPDIDVIEIDRQAQTITVDGVQLPYHVGAYGPRVRHGADTPDGAFHVTVTLTARQVRYV
ncbi:hypothetical protein NDR87_31560 [Nocardia sp. CDC159]|uniref:Uncharacterized protein n=1 Tax=Nocardia pulmonis TaxID=2951408 RepID=A0A9X2EBQ8_9NOCA|nr:MULTISPECIES: hypothetical protein [Nocardia]MCM6777912.1 hypothetical protein [Nocardia pulmonis]MCM6790917.1 hypothetical protein [Nocardia sp. CDC159]